MIHISEDQLLEYALEACDENERLKIEEHIESCERCSEALNRIRQDIDLIGSIRPTKSPMAQPVPASQRGSFVSSLLRVAAILAIGFVIGYSTSSITRPDSIDIAPAYVQLSPPADSLAGYAPSDGTGVE